VVRKRTKDDYEPIFDLNATDFRAARRTERVPLTDFVNGYGSTTRAQAYSKLEFANSYHLVFRDLPDIFRLHDRFRGWLARRRHSLAE
jgi:hypothetical protein